MAKNQPVHEESLAGIVGSMRLAPETKTNYLMRIRNYLKHTGKSADEFVADTRRDPRAFENQFAQFLRAQQPKLSPSTMAMLRDSVKKLLEVNRVGNIDWSYINEFVPRHKKFGEDRAPTLEEVRKVVEMADRRMKCLVLFLASSGSRIGSIAWLKWRDFEEVEYEGKRFAQLTVYRGEPEQYTTFVTPECYEHLLEYRASRERLGEKVTPASHVFVTMPNRRKFDASKVRPMPVKSMKNRLGCLLNDIGLRPVLTETPTHKNYEWKQAHGFRKFFKTRMEVAGAKPIITELLMGHFIGVSSSYMKPSAKELIKEYAGVIPALTVMPR